MNYTAYTDVRFHICKAAVRIHDSFTEMSDINTFVFVMNEGRLQYVLSSTLFNMYKRRNMFYVAICFKYLYSVNICTYI
jgi:hypothetical protein